MQKLISSKQVDNEASGKAFKSQMTQASSPSHHPPVSYIWTKVMTGECTNFRCNLRNNIEYLLVRARCNEKQPEGIKRWSNHWERKTESPQKASKDIFSAKRLWFQCSCSCECCQLGLTCGGWWREALKLDESCTPPGHKFAWLNQFLRLKHCWHMEERMTAKANNRFVGKKHRKRDRQLLSKPR